jgi:hypothetical protein
MLNSFFVPNDGVSVSSPDSDGYNRITLPDDGEIVLTSPTSVQLTKFTLRIDEVCSNGGSLIARVRYFGDNGSKNVVRINVFNIFY